MEADWSVELAAGDPVIVVPWAADDGSCQFLDLRENVLRERELLENDLGQEAQRRELQIAQPSVTEQKEAQLLTKISEARSAPVLRSALLQLNSERSPFWTAKCDAWLTENDETDLHEFDCVSADSFDRNKFLASFYIDVLHRNEELSTSFKAQERWLRALTLRLRREVLLQCARTDLVLRRAEAWGVAGFGATWFIEGCGPTVEIASRRRDQALEMALPIVLTEPLSGSSAEKPATLQ